MILDIGAVPFNTSYKIGNVYDGLCAVARSSTIMLGAIAFIV
ncbi:hypothetical protein PQG02_04915 [Nostoc sp. UHCC 0926]|nr:hypothetical protein [Nostoc sp. UHCC 0926]WDD33721.1 hypothetical protein PQG02_04915 [Nostoc sp. UHCC 0926]